MNREDVDSTIEAIDHAIEDWTVSGDAMRWTPEDASASMPGIPSFYGPVFDEFIAQDLSRRYNRDMNNALFRRDVVPLDGIVSTSIVAVDNFSEHISRLVESIREIGFSSWMTSLPQPMDERSVRQRALDARRNRNTGPADPHRLDGHRQRGR